MGRYKDEINELMDKQIVKGVSRYGQVLEDNPRGVIESLEYQSEELVDALFYTREAIEKMKKMEKSIKKVYAIANNVLWFDDNSDYKTALWEILYALNPDLEEYPELEYIEEMEDNDEL